MLKRISFLVMLCACSWAHVYTYLDVNNSTNTVPHYHWTNSFSGKIYHNESSPENGLSIPNEKPPPYLYKYNFDTFETEHPPILDQYGYGDVNARTYFNQCHFVGTTITNQNVNITASGCTGSPFFKVRSLEAPNAVFENATLETAYGMDLSGASIISSTITNSYVIFNDTYVREANLYLIGGEGSVRGTPYYLSDHIKIKNGNLIGERVRNHGANFSYTDLTDVEFNEYSSFVGANFTGCLISELDGNFSGANFGGAEIDDVGSATISNASFIASNIGGAHYTNLLNRGAILHLTSVRGSEIDSNTNFFDYAGVATNIHQEILDYLSELDAVSNQIESVSDSSEDLEDSVDLLMDSVDLAENNLNSLSGQVISLSNKVISTIHELEPNIEVIGASNGYIALNVGLSSSGDLNNWQTILSKEHVLPATNGVEYFRINTGSQKGQ